MQFDRWVVLAAWRFRGLANQVGPAAQARFAGRAVESGTRRNWPRKWAEKITAGRVDCGARWPAGRVLAAGEYRCGTEPWLCRAIDKNEKMSQYVDGVLMCKERGVARPKTPCHVGATCSREGQVFSDLDCGERTSGDEPPLGLRLSHCPCTPDQTYVTTAWIRTRWARPPGQ